MMPAAPHAFGAVQLRPYTVYRGVQTVHGAGLRVSGLAPLGPITKATGSYSPLQAMDNTYGFRLNNGVLVHPWMFGNVIRLYYLSYGFSYYRFAKMRLHFVPGCSTTTTGLFAVSCLQDAAQVFQATNAFNAANTFTRASESGSGFVTNSWAPAQADITNELDKEWKVLDTVVPSTSTAPEVRQAFAGVLYGGWSTSVTTDTNIGQLLIEYEVDLAGPYVYADGVQVSIEEGIEKGLTLRQLHEPDTAEGSRKGDGKRSQSRPR